MSVESIVLALVAGLGGSGTLLLLLRVGLPWARRFVSTATTVSGALEATRARLDATHELERTMLARILETRQAELDRCQKALAECEERAGAGS